METDLVKQETTPAHLIELAINANLDVEKLTKLMDMQRQYQADQARKAFFEAMNDFQSSVPELRKSKAVAFKDVRYSYAPLSDIVRQIKDSCRTHGLSYRWEVQDTKEEIKVTCIITHKDGHSEGTTMTASPDVTGSKNAIQARGSAIQYLQRYTLIGALGLSTADTDADGLQPDVTVDDLHKQYMTLYNELIQIDARATNYHPDNWKNFPNAKLYARAIAEIKQVLNLKKVK